ncbi:uncharacterized protein [Parasteatoda tepidariorum]|uniref:uncharacterized protein n=1 Tax=Parasteatoda tepidariorum TaxID=114398 RepID=UPI00077FB5EC|nr:uncharacterized protein LOC107456179 [Parasteatoda tepidariorum]
MTCHDVSEKSGLMSLIKFLQRSEINYHKHATFTMFGDKLTLLWSAIHFLLFSRGCLFLVEACHPESRELHICFNIYLERDLPLVETIVEGQQKAIRYGNGRVLLEDTDIQTICRHAAELQNCFKTLLPECSTYWQMNRYMRMMNLFQNVYSYLCESTTNNVRDLLLNTKCLTMAESFIANCSIHGFSWSFTWKEVLRMRVSPADRCQVIDHYRTCLIGRLQNVLCGEEAARVYGSLLDVWLLHWCNKGVGPEKGLEYFYLPVIAANQK